MKKHFSITLILFSVLILASCGKKTNVKKQLVGTWHGKEFTPSKDIKMAPEEEEMAKAIVKSTVFTFNENGTSQQKALGGVERDGKWEYNEDTEQLNITYTDPQFQPQSLKVMDVTATELKLENAESGMGKMTFTFEKK